MRKLINLSKQTQKKLLSQFPDILKVNACEDGHKYKRIAISVFDHWLLEDEALKLLNNINEEEQKRRNDLLYAFNKVLFDRTLCFTYRFKGRNKNHPVFKRFVDKNAACCYVKPNGEMAGKFLYKLVLPELEALYFEGWDNTCHLYFKDKKTVNNLIEWVKESGLYMLD